MGSSTSHTGNNKKNDLEKLYRRTRLQLFIANHTPIGPSVLFPSLRTSSQLCMLLRKSRGEVSDTIYCVGRNTCIPYWNYRYTPKTNQHYRFIWTKDSRLFDTKPTKRPDTKRLLWFIVPSDKIIVFFYLSSFDGIRYIISQLPSFPNFTIFLHKTAPLFLPSKKAAPSLVNRPNTMEPHK